MFQHCTSFLCFCIMYTCTAHHVYTITTFLSKSTKLYLVYVCVSTSCSYTLYLHTFVPAQPLLYNIMINIHTYILYLYDIHNVCMYLMFQAPLYSILHIHTSSSYGVGNTACPCGVGDTARPCGVGNIACPYCGCGCHGNYWDLEG